MEELHYMVPIIRVVKFARRQTNQHRLKSAEGVKVHARNVVGLPCRHAWHNGEAVP